MQIWTVKFECLKWGKYLNNSLSDMAPDILNFNDNLKN